MKRKPLRLSQVRTLLDRQDGKCGNGCGTALVVKPRNFIDEHLQALGRGGSNALKNRALWCIPCAKTKTHGNGATGLRSDLGEIRKTKNLIEKYQGKPKAKCYRWQSRPLKGRSSWPSRKFARRPTDGRP